MRKSSKNTTSGRESTEPPAPAGEVDGRGEGDFEGAFPSGEPGPGAGATDGDELNAFIRKLAETKKRREYQLSIIRDFFEDPLKFGVQGKSIPIGSSKVELERRRRELEYRRDLLKAVLEATEGELEFLDKVEAEDSQSDKAPD